MVKSTDPYATAHCVIQSCFRYAFGRTQADLDSYLDMAGWGVTPHGVLCPAHMRERAVTEWIARNKKIG